MVMFWCSFLQLCQEQGLWSMTAGNRCSLVRQSLGSGEAESFQDRVMLFGGTKSVVPKQADLMPVACPGS